MVGICCVQPFNALVGDNDASANVYVTSAVGFDGAVAPRLYNNIVALFKPSCPSPPPENAHCVPSHMYILLPSSVSTQISPLSIPLVGALACLKVLFLDSAIPSTRSISTTLSNPNCSASPAKVKAFVTLFPRELSENILAEIYIWVA